ncbi:MAG: hypothetical protein K2M07_08435 [Muribaculaceae bacterium]|nr:hypothetical protein [Muribaculaceae bacterium]
MFEISGLTIALVIITIALMGGFSSRKHGGKGSSKSGKLFVNDITSVPLTAEEVNRYANDKSPLVLEVKIAGRSVADRRKTIEPLNEGERLYVAWTNAGSDYSIVFIDCLKNKYGTAFDKDKEEIANRYDFIKGAVVETVDKNIPRLVIKVLFT